MASVWRPEMAPSGHRYFYNTETGQSAWELPDGASIATKWTELQAPSGHSYFVNVETGESSWSLPDGE
eukprot:6819262-Prymnesium_polylepis.1